MEQKIENESNVNNGDNNGLNDGFQKPLQSQPMFNSNLNGTWSQCRPGVDDNGQINNNNNTNNGMVPGLLNYNYSNIVPTPPIQPLFLGGKLSDGSVSNYDLNGTTATAAVGGINGGQSGATAVNDNGYGVSGLCNYGLTNVICNTNYFYGSNGSLHSASNKYQNLNQMN